MPTRHHHAAWELETVDLLDEAEKPASENNTKTNSKEKERQPALNTPDANSQFIGELAIWRDFLELTERVKGDSDSHTLLHPADPLRACLRQELRRLCQHAEMAWPTTTLSGSVRQTVVLLSDEVLLH